MTAKNWWYFPNIIQSQTSYPPNQSIHQVLVKIHRCLLKLLSVSEECGQVYDCHTDYKTDKQALMRLLLVTE